MFTKHKKGPRKMVILGSQGLFGSKLFPALKSSEKNTVWGFDIECYPDIEPHIAKDVIADKVISLEPDIIWMTISIDNQPTHGPEMIGKILESTRKPLLVIQVNSIQDPVKRAYTHNLWKYFRNEQLRLINVHPLHGAAAFQDQSVKKWILTDISGVMAIHHSHELETILLEMPKNCGTFKLIDIRDWDITLSGSELHDMAVAYYQTIFHVIKTHHFVHQWEWYKKHFSHVRVPFDFSKKLIALNPFAQKTENELGLEKEDSIKDILTKVKIFLERTNIMFPGEFRVFKTKNVEILEKLAK